MRDKTNKKQLKELEKKALELEEKLKIKDAATKAAPSFQGENQANVDEPLADVDDENIVSQSSENFFDGKDKDLKDNAETAVSKVQNKIIAEDLVDYCDFIESEKTKLDKHVGRIAGSGGEKRAAASLRDLLLRTVSERSYLEPFKSQRLRGKGSLVVLGGVFAFFLLLFLISFSFSGIANIIFSSVVLVLFCLSFLIIITLALGFPIFKFLYPKRVSYNVVSEVVSSERPNKTVIITTNYDSKLGYNFKIKENVAALLVLLSLISLIIVAVLMRLKISLSPLNSASFIGILLPSFFIGVFFSTFLILGISLSKIKAVDNNGYGALTALAAVKYLKDKNILPKDIKVVFASFAADNAGHGGAEGFLVQHEEEGLFENAQMLNFGDMTDSNLTVVSRDFFRNQKYDKNLIENCIDAAVENDLIIDNYLGYLNSTQGFSSSVFSQKGIKAATVLSSDMNINPLKKEKIEKVDRNTIENGFIFAVSVIEKILGAKNAEDGKDSQAV